PRRHSFDDLDRLGDRRGPVLGGGVAVAAVLVPPQPPVTIGLARRVRLHAVVELKHRRLGWYRFHATTTGVAATLFRHPDRTSVPVVSCCCQTFCHGRLMVGNPRALVGIAVVSSPFLGTAMQTSWSRPQGS